MHSCADHPPSPCSPPLPENASAKGHVLWRATNAQSCRGERWWRLRCGGEPTASSGSDGSDCSATLCPHREKKPCQEQLEAHRRSSKTQGYPFAGTARGMRTVHQPFCLAQGKHESKNHLLPKFYRFISPSAPHLANQDC